MAPERKICSRERLIALRNEARSAGRTVVHCHGCFDIVHPGHVRHLQFARSLGDILVVTVSADPQVNKGVNRPLIPDDLRAANLAALECVDWVHVNPEPTAVTLLDALRPDVYVKGKEYESNNDPRFLAERDTVTRHEGRVVFSSGDVVFSSTHLINGMNLPEILGAEKVRRFRERFELDVPSLYQLVEQFAGQRIIVVGDYILDRYHYCEATGIASDSPVMTLRSHSTADFDGGAGVIALHLAGLGASAELVTSLSPDEASAAAESRLIASGVDVTAPRQRRDLIIKHRFLADETKVFKVDEGSQAPLDSQAEEDFAERILAASEDADGIIFADFGYGLITSGLLDRIMPTLRERVRIIAADVSGRQSTLLRFRNVDLLCPTEREVRETLHDFSSGLNAAVWNLLCTTGACSALITLGKEGLVAFDQHRIASAASNDQSWERRLRGEYLPALTPRALDPLGCGDALLATASLTLTAGGSLQAAAFLGSLAAAIEAEHPGNHPLSLDDLFARLHEVPKSSALPLVA